MPDSPAAPPETASTSYIDAISMALRDEMRRDPTVFLMGQDIAEYGGAFKVTKGFVEEFGKKRVINTPIAESGTIGIAVGAALLGRRPVVEMQFADFISCGFNQVVNVAAKMYWRTGIPVPLVIRCPAGGGGGAGPFHSQSMEAWFLHAPGLKVVMPAFPGDARGLLVAAIRDPDPVIFLEHKYLYRRVKEPLDDEPPLVPLGSARIRRRGRNLTVIAYGWMAHLALDAAAAAEAEGISVEVLDLRSLAPLDEKAILESARRTGKVLIVHEAPLTGGFGAEIAARIADQAFEHLDGPVRRLAYPDTPVPYQKDLEAAALPDAGKILGAIRELAAW
jgi:2-oxoisovalerate dehydrogenase E1 component beta subunit